MPSTEDMLSVSDMFLQFFPIDVTGLPIHWWKINLQKLALESEFSARSSVKSSMFLGKVLTGSR